ncbi:MAG: cupin domain-containing protein [Thermoflexus sp.]|jgi:quercetin dioxygenase-like cupin family protein|nr:cupin domain-containing protein [Thermoflexus sp.]
MSAFDPRRPAHFTMCERLTMTDAGARGAYIRWIIDTRHGAPTYRLRVIELEPGGHTPLQSHWFEQEDFILSGEGEVQIGDQTYPIRAGDVVFVPPYMTHQYRNTRQEPLRFLSGIPAEWVRAARPDVYGELEKGPSEG